MGTAADTATAAREQFMHRAIELARRSLAAGGPPVGAVLVRDGAIIAEAGNAVVAETDVTAHAEIVLLRQACRHERRFELAGDELYATVEPCMMCFAACGYAGIGAIYFGAPITELAAITGHEMPIGPNAGQGPALQGDVCRPECVELLEEWRRLRELRSGDASAGAHQPG